MQHVQAHVGLQNRQGCTLLSLHKVQPWRRANILIMAGSMVALHPNEQIKLSSASEVSTASATPQLTSSYHKGDGQRQAAAQLQDVVWAVHCLWESLLPDNKAIPPHRGMQL